MLEKWSGQCKTQTADYGFHHANEYETTIVPLFSNLKTIARSQSALCILHCPIVHSGGEQAGGALENKGWEGNKTRRRKGREAVGSDFRSLPTESTLCVFYLIISISIFVEKIS